MTHEEKEKWLFLYSKMVNEGFNYCFTQYSKFEEIEDKEFHKLRKQYIKISEKLNDYILNKYTEEIDEYDD